MASGYAVFLHRHSPPTFYDAPFLFPVHSSCTLPFFPTVVQNFSCEDQTIAAPTRNPLSPLLHVQVQVDVAGYGEHPKHYAKRGDIGPPESLGSESKYGQDGRGRYV